MIDPQQELDDEILSACRDGELSPSEADAVRRRLAREPEFAERLHAMQYVDGIATAAFQRIDRQALPERTLGLLYAAEAEDRPRRLESINVVPLQRPSRDRRSSVLRWPVALAAGAAFGAGFLAGVLMPDDIRLRGAAAIGQPACEQGTGAANSRS